MGSTISVVVRDDPRRSHRPVEALRIALGLAAGDHDVTVVLLGEAPLLLTDDTDDIVDVDILEKYLPSFKQLGIPFVVTGHDSAVTFQPGFSVKTQNPDAIQRLVTTAQHTLVFWRPFGYMAGRKLLYMLRQPLAAEQANDFLPGGISSSLEDDISVVLLDAAVADSRQFPGRTFVLLDNHGPAAARSDVEVISYADLVRLVVEADSTIVI